MDMSKSKTLASRYCTLSTFKEALSFLASPSIVFFMLPWLIVLLVIGTVMQRELGLYEAQRLYFSSWIVWFGPIPLPGGYTTLGALTLCLLAKFLVFSPWRAQNAGIILTHLGILVLLIGGMLTAFTQKEGFLLLKEGQRGNAVSDYHARVFTIEKDDAPLTIIPFKSLEKGLAKADLPFRLSVESTCRNCRPVAVEDTQDNRHGLAEQVSLQPAPLDKQNEGNLSGAMIRVSETASDQDGLYLTMEDIPHKPEIIHDGSTYRFYIGRAQTILPFEIELTAFKREMHPGTDMARGFSSDIIVQDGEIAWPYHIRMNEPLRYKGYTFYQASFSLRPDGHYSILSVVENKGRIFPYLASAIIFCGLLLHVVLRMKNKKERVG